MKNTILIIISITLSLFLSCCGEKEKYKIGVSQCSSDDWRSKMNEELLLESMVHDDIVIEIRSAESSSQKQIEDIKYFAENGFDIIIAAPNEAEALTPVIREVYEQGIPVIIFDRNINDTTYTQIIGVDNVGLGVSAAEFALSILPDSIIVMEISGLPGSTPAADRAKGFREGLEKGKGKIAASTPADWIQEKAEIVADSLLKKHPEVNLIFAHNDRMAIGASEVAKKSGREDIKIIGIDAAPEIGVKAVADGVIDATFLYPTEGYTILREAIKILKKQPYEKQVMIPSSSAVDYRNADILLRQNKVVEEDYERIKTLKSQINEYMSRETSQTILLWAIILIVILLFSFLFLVLKAVWQHRRHKEILLKKNKLLEEQRDKQKELNQRLEEATQSKLVFFTNVSHDLRTPLTLISEPVSQLNGASNLDSRQKTLLKIADKNVKILERLINQILEFRKYENNKLDLNLTEVDFKQLVNDWLESFYTVANKRDIKLTLEEPDDDLPTNIAIDVEKIERVFFNLVSNALKYSPNNSRITVSYIFSSNRFILKVADTGEGISAENISHVFDSFFQVDKVRPKGSGIGLWLAKAFVELHNGTLTVESVLKKGSVFTISLPIVHVAETPQSVESGIDAESVNSELEEVETELSFEEEKPLILVIDDNRDIREMVAELMKDDYNVIMASNGKDGIRMALKYVPDLIICDVMMPGFDGMETCNRLKNEEVSSHIPILMLTACTMDEQRVQSFESGADGYLSKPFSTAVLKSHTGSLIENRKRIKNLYDKHKGSAHLLDVKQKQPKTRTGDIDNDFYNKFREIFDKEMKNPELNVEKLASEMGFERTQLYRKLKAITNYSPVELMRNLRLKKAKILLSSTDKSISEICYEVGFSTPAYFTKCFREQYGVTPKEMRER